MSNFHDEIVWNGCLNFSVFAKKCVKWVTFQSEGTHNMGNFEILSTRMVVHFTAWVAPLGQGSSRDKIWLPFLAWPFIYFLFLIYKTTFSKWTQNSDIYCTILSFKGVIINYGRVPIFKKWSGTFFTAFFIKTTLHTYSQRVHFLVTLPPYPLVT